MPVITGNVESMRRDRKGIKVGGEWYSAFNASQLDNVERKDDIEFEYTEKGSYKNIKGDARKAAGGSSASSGASKSPAKSGGYNSAGVEVGHAWNSAVQIVLADGGTVGKSHEDTVRECIAVAARVYAVCGALRAQAEAGTLDGTTSLDGAVEPPVVAVVPDKPSVDLAAITGGTTL